MDPSLEDLRRYAVARSLFTPTTLPAAIRRLGFVQADRSAPGAAQDDAAPPRQGLPRRRSGKPLRAHAIDEDCLVNYGFRRRASTWPDASAPGAQSLERGGARRKAADVLDFVRARGAVHPREVDQHFAHGRVKNYWGGSSNASTQLLDDMHYRGLLRVKRRDSGTRVYEAVAHPPAEAAGRQRPARAALIDLVVRKYAPLPAASLTLSGAPARLWRAAHGGADPGGVAARAREQRLPHRRQHRLVLARRREPRSRRYAFDERLRLLAPFDPVVWDRRRFTLFWDWTYKFEAYTPPARRQFGYYALPMLWQGRVIGWSQSAGARRRRRASRRSAMAGAAPRGAAFRGAGRGIAAHGAVPRGALMPSGPDAVAGYCASFAQAMVP